MSKVSEKIRTLIADDSVVYRSQIRAALTGIPGVEVVGAASNGRLALERLAQGSVDLLILDLEMPEMDGLTTLKELANRGLKTKVLVFSSASKRGAEITLDALRLGATDFIAKPGPGDADPTSGETDPSQKIRSLLQPKINAIFPDAAGSVLVQSHKGSTKYPSTVWDLLNPKIIVIGSSTGGPTVLETVFSGLLGPISCPIVIAQHMPPIFTATLAERISRVCGISAAEAKHGEILEKNKIYIAPGDFHLTLQGTADCVTLVLDQGPQINSVRPAVDPLFQSAARIFKDRCLGFVLTGMGADGKVGAEAIKDKGGTIVIQNEQSCVVFGMPGAVFTSGAYDRIETPSGIIKILNEKISLATPALKKPA